MRSFALFFAVLLSVTSWAADEARFPVTSAMEGKDLVTGRKVVIPPDRGYKFAIVDGGTLRPYMRVFDANGLEVQAFFALPSLEKAMTPEEKAALEEAKKTQARARETAAANDLKRGISTGLAATTKGAVVAKEGCCEVDGKKKAEPIEVASPEGQEKDATQGPPATAEQALQIESPPEDFYDASPDQSAANPRPLPKVLSVESTERVGTRPAAAPVAAEKPRRDEKRSPALQRPEPEPYGNLPEVVPVPKARPNLLDRASSARSRRAAEAAEDERPEPEAQPARRPASEFLCRAYDAFKAKGVPDQPLRQALLFLEKNKDKFGSERYLSIADYSQNSMKKRFYLLDLKTFGVIREKVSHGGGRGNSGDPDHDGMLNSCGGSGSEKTRGGFFTVEDYYFSQKGRYQWPMLTTKPPRNGMKLRGLTPGVNTSVYADGYVMHEAKYNSGGEAVMGRSDGCPAFVRGRGGPILEKLRGGSLQYHFTPQCGEHHRGALRQVRGWESFCR